MLLFEPVLAARKYQTTLWRCCDFVSFALLITTNALGVQIKSHVRISLTVATSNTSPPPSSRRNGFQRHSALTELNPGPPLTDFSSLNSFEQQWVAWYVWIGNPIIATGLMSYEVCHCLVYFFLGCANRTTFGVTAPERTAPHCLPFFITKYMK
jgi:hypothetical protein